MSRRPKKDKIIEHQKVIVVWIEYMEDYDKFPSRKLIVNSDSVSIIIYLQLLKTNLVQVRTVDVDGNVRTVAPLMDGVQVTLPAAGQLVRQTCINSCNRDRLESDTAQCLRKNALHNIKMKYAVNNDDLVESLTNLYL